MNYYLCTTCSSIHEDDPLLKKCPTCGMPASHFKMISEEDAKEIGHKRGKTIGEVMEDSIVKRGYKPAGYTRTPF